MIYWATLLHFYQPPTQIPAVLEKVCNESYRPLIEVFQQHPLAKASININAVLTEMLRDHGHLDVVRGLRELAERGQVEFVGSGKYHPILPLIPKDEMRRQIVQNKKSNRALFGRVYDPTGFFPPEMCYSREVVEPIVETAHEWVILSGVACPVEWPLDVIHRVEINGAEIAVLFRDDILSNKISFKHIKGKEFLQHLEALKGDRDTIYVVTAMDAETFGHHIQNWERLFLAEVYEALDSQNGEEERLAKYNDIKQRTVLAEQHGRLLSVAERANHIDVVTVSELLRSFPPGQ
ncbi:MAG: hypothetical protein M1358_17570, partial [Chloroflexi bacterium]|nr:hypothetical protein [Chloroflexota bacterium]